MDIIERGGKLWGSEPLDPQDVLDFELDLTTWLTAEGDTLAGVDPVTVTSVNCTARDPAVVGSTRLRAWVEGAQLTDDGTCSFTFHWTTTAGREKDKTINFKVKEN